MPGVLLKRFRLNRKAMEGHQIAFIDFPYWNALIAFQDKIKEIRNGRFLANKELPPWNQLNDGLMSLAPMLIQGFEETSFGKPRRMLALVDDGDGNPLWRPSLDLMRSLIWDWVELWVAYAFDKERQTPAGDATLQTLYANIDSNPESDWQVSDMGRLWDEKGELMWKSVPALLASMLVVRQQRRPLALSSGDTIQWRLAQDGNRLVVLSEPTEWSHTRSTRDGKTRHLIGLYSHKLEFGAQTVPGDPDAWIYIHHRVRRYASHEVKWLNEADVSILTQIAEARHSGWQAHPTFVRLRVRGTTRTAQYRWGVNNLLARHQARQLELPSNILKNPSMYARPEWLRDRYFVVYAEGLKPKHPMKTGVGMSEQAEVAVGVLAQMEDVLQSDTPFAIDSISQLSPKDVRFRRGQIDGLSIATHDGLEQSARKPLYQSVLRECSLAASRRASGGRPLQILLLAWASHSLHAMHHYVERTLFLNPDEHVEQVHIEDHLLDPMMGIPAEWQRLKPDSPRNDRRAEIEAHLRRWSGLIRGFVDPQMLTLAMIELPASTEDHLISWIRYVIRRSCAQNHVLSQMLQPVSSSFDPTRVIPGPSIETAVRLKNASRDLLLRQLHIVYADLSPLYERMGIPAGVARELLVIGLYRHRSKTHGVDYPLAICLHPNGRVQVCLPDPDSGLPLPWTLYTEAPPLLSEHMKHRNTRMLRDRSDTSRHKAFVRNLLDTLPSQPILLLLESDGWRGDVLALADKELKLGELGIKWQAIPWLKAESTPNVRIIRVRDAGTGNETPQWIASDANTWDAACIDAQDLKAACLLEARRDAMSVYYSIGRIPKMADNQDNRAFLSNLGGDIAFRHQQAVEMVPFFLQPSDNPVIWTRIAHALRYSSAWGQGNLTLPYPLHLARTLMEDMMTTVPSYEIEQDEDA